MRRTKGLYGQERIELTGGANGKQMEMFNREDYLVLKKRERKMPRKISRGKDCSLMRYGRR